MRTITTTEGKKLWVILALILTISLSFLQASPAHSHGGKKHDGEPFSAFQALAKATQLYDRLITSGKLAEAWETLLTSVSIEVRNPAESREYVVEFVRSEGDPGSVYFFFDEDGNYSGSNFTGK